MQIIPKNIEIHLAFGTKETTVPIPIKEKEVTRISSNELFFDEGCVITRKKFFKHSFLQNHILITIPIFCKKNCRSFTYLITLYNKKKVVDEYAVKVIVQDKLVRTREQKVMDGFNNLRRKNPEKLERLALKFLQQFSEPL